MSETREQKIEALVNTNKYEGDRYAYRQGILAGIALRDEELLAKVGEFDEAAEIEACVKDSFKYEKEKIRIGGFWNDFSHAYEYGARWQHEQIVKAIKGDGDA